MISLKYAHLCDYASADTGTKPSLIGIFDIVWDRGVRPIRLPMICFFVAKVECSLGDGATHDVRIVVRNDDEVSVHTADLGPVTFLPTGPGRPLAAQMALMVQGLPLPDAGDYTFSVEVDGTVIGGTSLYVMTPPAGTPEIQG